MERRYILTRTHTTTVHSYNDPATPAAATPAVRAAESAAPRPPHGHPLSRRAAALLLTLSTLILSLASPLHAQVIMNDPNAKVRLVFETRQIAAADAQKIITGNVPGRKDETNRWGDHYIDIWMYAYFNKAGFEKYVTGTNFRPKLTSSTISFYMQKEDGTIDRTRTIARIAPEYGRATAAPYPDGYNDITQPELDEGVNAFYATRAMDEKIQGWGAQGMFTRGPADGSAYYAQMVDMDSMEGEEWYRVKMTLIRFVWRSPQSFYVNFVGDGSMTEDKSVGTTNFNLYYNGTEPMSPCTAYQDWTEAAAIPPGISDGCGLPYRNCMKYIRGGVEIISGMEAELSNPICPGDPAMNTLKVTRYKSTEHSWDGGGNGSKALKYNCYLEYFNGSEWTGTTQIAASEGDAASGQPYFGTATGVLTNAVSTADNGALNAPFYIPAAWHGYNRDSLRLVVSLDPSAPTELPFKMYPRPFLKTAFAEGSISDFSGVVTVYGKKKGVGNDKDTIVGMESGSTVCAFAASKYLNSPLDSKKTYSSGFVGNGKDDAFAETYDIKLTQLWYSSTPFGDYTKVAENMSGSITSAFAIENSGYYYVHYKINGYNDGNDDGKPDFPQYGNICEHNSDTVYVKVSKILPAPALSISLGSDCKGVNEFKVEATAPGDRANGWQWALGPENTDVVKNPFKGGPWVVIPGESEFVAGGEAWSATETDETYQLIFGTQYLGGTGQFVLVAAGAMATYSVSAGNQTWACASDKNIFEGEDVENLGFWPLPEKNPEPEMKYSTPYSLNYFSGNGFYARYWVDGDTSAWGYVLSCEDPEEIKTPLNFSSGISATSCLAKNFLVDKLGLDPGKTDTTVNPGETVKLRYFITYDLAEPKLGEIKIGEDLDGHGLVALWQVRNSNDDEWRTWYRCGAGSYDLGTVHGITMHPELNQFPYIEAERKNIRENEQHRVIFLVGNCERNIIAEAECNYIGFNTDHGTCKAIEDDPDMSFGNYDIVVNISVGASMGTLKARKTNTGVFVQDELDHVCVGDLIDLKLEGGNLPDGTQLKWEYNPNPGANPEGWVLLSPQPASGVTEATGINPTTGVTWGANEYSKNIEYRVSVTNMDDDAPEAKTVTVTVKRAPKVYIGWENGAGAWCKSPTVGYCYGDDITVYALTKPAEETKTNLYTSAPTTDISFIFQKQSQFTGTSGIGGVSQTYRDADVFTGAQYRIVAKNKGDCPVYSDTATIKINPQVVGNITPETKTVCVGTDVEFASIGTAKAEGVTYIWYYNDGSGNIIPHSQSDSTITLSFPMNSSGEDDPVGLVVSKVYGDVNSTKEKDKITCFSDDPEDPTLAIAWITTQECKPTLKIVGDNSICAGNSVTLAWVEDENYGKFVHGTDVLKYAISPSTSYTTLNASEYTYRDSTGAGGVKYGLLTISGTHSILNPSSNTTYSFKASKKDKTESDAVTLTVKAKPTIDQVTLKLNNFDTLRLCEGATDVVTAAAQPAGTGYTYTWIKDGSTIATNQSYTRLIGAVGGTVQATTYKVRVVRTVSGCVSEPKEGEATLIVNALPEKPTITQYSSALSLCQGDNGELEATVNYPTQDGVTYAYKWYYTGNNSAVTTTGPKLTFGPSGNVSTANKFNRNYYLVITSTKGTCSSETDKPAATTASVSVIECGDDALTPSSYSKCPGTAPETFTLTLASGVNPTSVTWQESTDGSTWTSASGTTGGAITAGSAYTFTPSAIPAAGTTKKYRAVIVRGGNTIEMPAVSYTTYANPVKPVLTATATPAEVCEKASTTIKVTHDKTTDYGYTYSWTGPGSYTSTAESFTLSGTNLTTAKSGAYTVNAVATSGDGCTVNADAATVNLTVNSAPTMPAAITVGNGTVCPGASHTFHPTISTASDHTYTWIWRSGSSTGTKVQGPSTGMGTTETDYTVPGSIATNSNSTLTYNVMVKVNTAKSCTDSINKNVTLTVRPKPTISSYTISLSPVSACEGAVVTNGMSATASASASAGTNFTYIWYDKDGIAVNTTTTTTHKFIPNGTTIALSHDGNYGVRVAVEDNDGCRSDTTALKTAKFTVNPLPAKPTIGALANGVICSNQSYTFTPTVTVDNTAGVTHTYTWYYSQGPDPSNTSGYLSFTGKDLKICERALSSTCNGAGIGSTNTLKARLYVTSTKGTCSRTEEGPVVTYTVSDAPEGTLSAEHASIKVCAGSDTTLKVTLNDPTNVASETFTWSLGGTPIPGANSNTYKVTNVGASNTGKYTITDTLKNDQGCRNVATASIELSSSTPTNLDNIAVSGAVKDKCFNDGSTVLSVTGIQDGNPKQTYQYQWYKDGSIISGETFVNCTIPADFSKNGKYSCKVTVSGTAQNPCSAEKTTPEVEMTYKMCGAEALTPGSDPKQNNDLAIICQKGNESSAASVTFNTTIQAAAITKLTWMKYTTEPAETSTTEGTVIKTLGGEGNPAAAVPTTLTQSEVFGSETAPKNYYVRLKIERGTVVSFSKTYRFVKVENPTAPNGTIDAAKEVCINTTGVKFTVTASKPGAPTSGAYTGLNPVSNALSYIWTVGGVQNTNTGASQSANTSAVKNNEAYTARVVSSYTYGVTGLSNTCYDTGAVQSSTLTVKAQPTVTLTISAASACRNAIPDNLTLTATPTPADVALTWKRTAPSAKTLTVSGTTYTLAAGDIVLPAPGAASGVKNTYEVTAAGGVCNSPSSSVDFTVNPIPDLASVTITPGATYCNDADHVIEATPKKSDGTAITSYTDYTWKWEKSPDGINSWSSAAGTNNQRTYTIGRDADDGTYYYRCTVKVSGSCPVTVISDTQSYVIEPNTVGGSLSVDNNGVCSSATTNLPKVTLSGNTGSLKTLTFACGTNTVTKTDPDATSPYTLTTAELATLLNGTTGRELTVAVNATVQSGSCNAEAPNPANFKVYKPVPDIELTEADKVWCNLSSGSPKVNLKQAGGAALVLTSVEKIKWEKVGTASSVATAPATMNLIENNSTALYKDLSSSNYPSPKRDADTVYWFRATISSPGGCSDTKTATIKQTVLRQPVKPTLVSAPTEVCEGSPYTISAKRPGASDLVWKEVVSGTENAITSGTSYNNTTGAEELTVGAAVTGTHTYKVYDKRPQQGTCPELLSASLDISVTVNQKPVAGQIEASAGGVFCSGESVVVKHKSGTTLVAPTNKINWQVCTDTSNYPASKVDKERPNAEASVNYSASGFAAGTYFVRYVVPANGECQAVQSKWVGVTVINAVSVPAVSPLGTVCEGTEVTLSFTASEGLKYEIFANTATGSPLETITTAGPVNHKITAVPSTTDNRSTRDYFVKVTNTSYVGGGNCGTATSPAITLTVDAKPVGGTLLFANNSKDTLTANVADHAYLQLSGAKGNPLKAFSSTQPQGGSYGSATDIGAISTSANKDVPLQVSHMEKTMFWVVAQNGVCPDANSDTVVVTVKSANDPTLGITSPICEVITDATLTINVPETLKGTFQWTAVEWFRRTYTAGMGDGDGWYPITTVNDVSGTTGAPTTVTTTDPGARTLSPGTYQYRYSYVYGTGTSGYSNPATLQVDATSKGGALTVDPVAKVCQDGASPKLKLTGDVVGSIVANSLKKGTTSTAINSAVAGGSTDPTSVYSVPTGSDNLGVHYYQVQVKNGVCPADTSCSVAVEVIQKPVAGTLTVANTLCYDQGTTTVTLGNDKVGTSIKWSTATSQSGSYSPVAANDDQTTYTVGPLTDRLWVQVTVNTDEVCTAVSTTAEVKVYDTLTITTQPQDKTVVGSGSASFTVAASTAGIPYLDGSGDKHVAVSAGSYKWYHSTDNGTTWSAVNDDGDYSGATTVTLTVANAQNHPNEMFYCVVKDDKCSRPVTSNSAKIVAMDELNPGKTNSLTLCACYYPSDPALYYVEGAAGQGDLYYRWQVSTKYPNDPPTSDDHWQDITDFDLDYTPSAQGDSIVFTAVGTVMAKGIYWIRALVHDDYTSDWQSAESNLIKVCEQDKPTYTFKGDIVCERESGDEREFKYTAVPNHIDGRSIKYGYALPSDPTNFTEINIPNGTDATTDVKFGEGENEKTLRFIVKAADSSLVIPASSAIPFEADSMVIRMEVRSCYTPAPLATNTDTTIYVLLRVDAPVQITARAQDTIICKDASFNMETGYGLLNKTIAGNEVSAKWYKTGTPGEQDSKTYPGNADGVAVHAFTDLTSDDAGTWFVNLSTKYCPAVTDTMTVDVKNAPVITSLEATEACAGSEITLTAMVNETASPAAYTITWQRRDRNGQWRDVLGAGVSSDSIAASYTTGSTNKPHYLHLKKGSPADAGRYRAVLTITGACASTDNTHEVDVKVNVKPEYKDLSRKPYVPVAVGSLTSVTVTYKSASELATLYNVEDGYLVVKTPVTYTWMFMKPDGDEYKPATDNDFMELVTDGHTGATITIKGVDGFSGTQFYAIIENGCGSSESTVDTLLVSDKFTITDVDGPKEPLCQDNNVQIKAFTSAAAAYVEWNVSTDNGATWKTLTIPSAQAGFAATYDSAWDNEANAYTLIINKVDAGMDGFKYRAVVHDDANPVVWDTMKDEAVVTLQVFSDKSPFALTIRDGGDDDMQDGDVRDQHQVIFKIYDTVSGTGNDAYKQYYNKLCVMRRITKDSSAVVENTCVDAPAEGFVFPVTIPSFNANVEEHDSTQYFVMAYNHCGKVASDTNLLRVYDTLIVRWMADRIIYTEAGDKWSVDSLSPDEIVPGMLIDVYSKFDSTPLQAHVFLCDSTFIIFNDTTLKGFMNPVDEEEENTHSSRWWMKKPYEEEWEFANPYDWTSRNTEHKGAVGTTSDGFFTLEDDSLQIKGWGVNNLYCDSTSVLTIHMMPRLNKGDLVMTPSEISLCESAPGNDQTFTVSSKRYTDELWAQAAASYNLQWQYRTPEDETWVDVDTNAGRTLWHFGVAKAEHDGWRIRVVATALCGNDTVEALIHVTPSVAPQVLLVSDSACLGDELVFTATTENMGEKPVFEWFVDDAKDEKATGAEYRVSGLPAGAHNIMVRAKLTDATLCVNPDNASDTKVAVVYALPQIKADIHDTIMKNIDTTSVWVKGQGDYTYAWTPETGLLDATSDSTLLWGLEAREEPHVYVVTATDEHGCQAQDSVEVIIESNFTIDSLSIVTIVPPVLDLDDGTLPGYPSEPEDSYYPELGGTPFGGELMFRNDTVADLWICAHNTALIHFYVRGGEKPITYTWTIDEGNATLVYPVDAKEDSAYSFKENDSVFGIFFPDTTTHTMHCEILDKTGVGGAITVNVHYYKPEMFYLEVTPKVTSGKYYEQQALNFSVRPDRNWLTTWVDMRNGTMVDSVTNRKMNRQMSFSKQEGDETSIWISTVDRHGCRIWDSVSVHIIPLPNVLLVGDPKNGVLFPEFEVEVTSSWGLKVKAFEDRNGNGNSRGWDGRTKSGTYVTAGTYYYRVKIPTLDKQGYMIVNGAVTVVNK